jgi:hypothetical protein
VRDRAESWYRLFIIGSANKPVNAGDDTHDVVYAGMLYDPTRLLERKRPTLERYPELWELVIRIVRDAVDRGALPPDEMIQRSGR